MPYFTFSFSHPLKSIKRPYSVCETAKADRSCVLFYSWIKLAAVAQVSCIVRPRPTAQVSTCGSPCSAFGGIASRRYPDFPSV